MQVQENVNVWSVRSVFQFDKLINAKDKKNDHNVEKLHGNNEYQLEIRKKSELVGEILVHLSWKHKKGNFHSFTFHRPNFMKLDI